MVRYDPRPITLVDSVQCQGPASFGRTSVTHHRFTIEYCTRDGERRRVVYLADMNGLRWFRREDIYEEGQWIRHSHEEISAPAIEARHIGSGSFAGP